MRFLRAVDTQRRKVAHKSLGPHIRDRGFTRRCKGMQGRDRRGVVDHALEGIGKADELPQPAERHRFQFRRGGGSAPQHRLLVERCGEKVGKHAWRAARDREIGKKRRVVPVRETGYEHALEVGHDVAEGFRVLRRSRR
jgi:hypothetical protein